MSMTSVEKALALIAAVASRGHESPAVSELARRTGLSKSTAFRLLNTLERGRALERVGDGYHLGPLLGANLTLPTDPQTERVQVMVTPFLAALYERTRQTVQLAVLEDDGILFLNKLHGLHRVPSPSRIGASAPAHCTSLGKVLMAFDRQARERILARPLDRWTTRTVTDPEILLRQISTAERTRIGVDDGEYVAGVASIASVVTDSQGMPVASLCVTGPSRQIIGQGYERAVLEVCAMASRAYGAGQSAAG